MGTTLRECIGYVWAAPERVQEAAEEYQDECRRLCERNDRLEETNMRLKEKVEERERLMNEMGGPDAPHDLTAWAVTKALRDQMELAGIDVSGCDDAADLLHDLNEALCRLAPEGAEVPVDADGSPVWLDSRVYDDRGHAMRVIALSHRGKACVRPWDSERRSGGRWVALAALHTSPEAVPPREEPDSWERLVETTGLRTLADQDVRDIIRRVKALAGGGHD